MKAPSPPCRAAVKDGRHSGGAACSNASRPLLDGHEHGGTLNPFGLARIHSNTNTRRKRIDSRDGRYLPRPGPAWRETNRGHVSLDQLKVMSAIERCRTAALGGHVARCENEACGHTLIAYNSCRNRHCPKCQGAASRRWTSCLGAFWTPALSMRTVS